MARVLVIEDEAGNRKMLRQMLEQAGHQVFEAENGVAGLDAMRAQPPEIVITDIIMPRKDGIETIVAMRKELPTLRIIAMSGGGRTKNLDFLKIALKAGADAALPKPFRMPDLLKAVDEAVKAGPRGA